MSIFLTETDRVIVQGMTGSEGRKHTTRMLSAGTKVVAGVNPRKAGTTVAFDVAPIGPGAGEVQAGTVEVPVYGTVAEAKEATGAEVSVVFVPPAFAKGAVVEAVLVAIGVLVLGGGGGQGGSGPGQDPGHNVMDVVNVTALMGVTGVCCVLRGGGGAGGRGVVMGHKMSFVVCLRPSDGARWFWRGAAPAAVSAHTKDPHGGDGTARGRVGPPADSGGASGQQRGEEEPHGEQDECRPQPVRLDTGYRGGDEGRGQRGAAAVGLQFPRRMGPADKRDDRPADTACGERPADLDRGHVQDIVGAGSNQVVQGQETGAHPHQGGDARAPADRQAQGPCRQDAGAGPEHQCGPAGDSGPEPGAGGAQRPDDRHTCGHGPAGASR